MSWRRGELWLDGDVLWFRDGAGAPALAGLPPAIAPGAPPGLHASRQRRDAWTRRRHARRARATALALSPAVVLALASLRSGGDPATSAVGEDPPSLTFRLGPPRLDAGERPARWGAAYESARLAREPAPKPVRHPSVVRAHASVKIDWHRATSVGLPWAGTLIDGTQLPVEGPDWVTWDPLTDSVPNVAGRLYGNQRTIRAIVSVAHSYRVANPGAPRLVVGDISRRGGGPLADEHVSHQNGLDVDVYLPRRDGTLRAPTATDQIDRRLAQALVDRFVAAGAQMIFVGFSSGLHGPAAVVVPYANHEYHLHVRFPPPGG